MVGLEGDKYDLERGEKLKQFEVKTFIAECQNFLEFANQNNKQKTPTNTTQNLKNITPQYFCLFCHTLTF